MNQRTTRNAIEASLPADSKEPKRTIVRASDMGNPTPQALNESAIFEANLLAARFFDAAMITVKNAGSFVRYDSCGRAMAAATLASAAAAVYCASIQASQAPRRTRKAVKS